jgi:glycosyltransferase involved in cell wall biosynthesis
MVDAAPEPPLMLLQYVPHMYGIRGMNLAFIWRIARFRHVPMWVMFHELYVTVRKDAAWKYRLVAAATQFMCRSISRRADYCFTTTMWGVGILRGLTRPGIPVEWAPVPSNIATLADCEAVRALRERLRGNSAGPLVGHFAILDARMRHFVETAAARFPEWKFVFVGRRSREFLQDLIDSGVIDDDRAIASGGVDPDEAARWISACDVLVQLYPHGACGKRGSLMAALALGKAVVTNSGLLTEPLWKESRAVYVVDGDNAGVFADATEALLNDVDLRAQLESNAGELYQRQFSLEWTIARLERACPT